LIKFAQFPWINYNSYQLSTISFMQRLFWHCYRRSDIGQTLSTNTILFDVPLIMADRWSYDMLRSPQSAERNGAASADHEMDRPGRSTNGFREITKMQAIVRRWRDVTTHCNVVVERPEMLACSSLRRRHPSLQRSSFPSLSVNPVLVFIPSNQSAALRPYDARVATISRRRRNAVRLRSLAKYCFHPILTFIALTRPTEHRATRPLWRHQKPAKLLPAL